MSREVEPTRRLLFVPSKHLAYLLVGGLFGLVGCQPQLWNTYSSPDNQHCLVVRSYPMLIALPGQGSDASGTVTLYTASGDRLHEADLDMMQHLGQVEWQGDRLSVGIGLDTVSWPLPQKQAATPAPADGCHLFQP